MLDAIADRLCLEQLGGVQHRVKVRGIQEGLFQVIHDFAIGRGVALVLLHHIGENIPVLRPGEALTGLEGWEGLKPELRYIAEVKFTVFREGLVPVPNIPVVCVSPVLVVGLVERPAGGRAGGPIKGVGVIPPAQLGQQVFIHLHIVTFLAGLVHPYPQLYKHLHLVVAAPQSQTGMVAEALDVVHRLGNDIGLKSLRQIIYRAGEHKVLPHHQTQLVTGVIEGVCRIVSASPHPDAVMAGGPGLLQQPAGALRRHSGQDAVLRDVVCPHGEDFHAVDHMAELLSPLVLIPTHRHGAQPDTPLPAVDHSPI